MLSRMLVQVSSSDHSATAAAAASVLDCFSFVGSEKISVDCGC